MASVTSSLLQNPVFVSQSSNKNINLFSSPIPFHPPQPRVASNRRRNFAVRADSDEVAVLKDAVSEVSSFVGIESKLASVKLKLLSAVAGLNKGLSASEEDLQKADDVAKEVEAAGGPVDLKTDIEKLQGKWKLVYSSGFSSRTLGGSRPGPPLRRLLPISLGQVFQRIDVLSKDFDNIVELELGAPWPLPPLQATATLAHKFEVIGTARIKITFEKTTVKTKGNLAQLPELEIPQIPEGLRPQSNKGSGEFEVTYLDSDTRITRGDKGELRVFVVA